MKAASGNNGVIFLASLVFMMHSTHASAACSRDDVTFYLEKGFTTEQITALCSEVSKPAADAPQAESEKNEQPPASEAVDDNALFLSRAIKAQKINLSSDSLSYTQEKMCIKYGEEDLFGFTPKVCPDVIFTIALKGLEVLDTGKKYGFYGTPEVRVKSAIKREIIGDLKDQKPEDRELILNVFEQGNETAIPIRDDFSLEQVKQVLEELSK